MLQLRISDSGMDHRLLVPAEVILELWSILLSRLRDPSNVSVAKDSPYAGKEWLGFLVLLHILIHQKTNDRLSEC
jgi:hypothetical protein